MDIILEKIDNIKVNKKLLYDYSKSKCNKIVNIVFFGRSGSQFLFNLLESHPNFLSIKSEFRQFWINSSQIPIGDTIKEQLFNFLNIYATFNENGEHQMVKLSGSNEKVHVPKDLIFSNKEQKSKKKENFPNIYKFIKYFLELSSLKYKNKRILNKKEFFDTVFLSYSLSIQKAAQKEFIILHNLHIPDKNAINRIEMFYDTTIIHTIRHPIQSLASHIKRYLKPGKRFNGVKDNNIVYHCLAGLFKDDQQLKSKDDTIEYGVKLEDIHKELRLVLSKILKKLNMKFHHSCLIETSNGLPTKGMIGYDGKRVKNTRNQKDLFNYTEYFSNKDICKLQNIFKKNFEQWNYKFLRIKEENEDSRVNIVFDFIKDIEKKNNLKIDDQIILDLIFKKVSSQQSLFKLVN